MTQHPHPNLSTPGKLVPGGLRIVALGGISEIGRNMTVFETDGKLLIVDCGVLFPEDNQGTIPLDHGRLEHLRSMSPFVLSINPQI